jgi:hypothetical protein
MRGSWANISKNRLILFVISVLTFCAVWIGYGLLESAKYEQQAKDKVSEYTDYTRDKVTQACAGGDKIENIKCVTEAFEAKREYEYGQSDLVAQRQSALWAYIMAAAAVFGIALSAVGVWLVKTTFDETRKANVIAQNAVDIQHRPVLVFEDIGIEVYSSSGCFFFKAIWKNIGSSPALIIECGISREFIGAIPSHEILQVKIRESSNVSNTREIVRVDQGPVKSPKMRVDANSLAHTKGIDHEAANLLINEGRSLATAGLPMKDYINGQCKIVCWVKYINVFSKENAQKYDSKNISSFCFNIDGEGKIFPQLLGGSIDEMT